MLTVALGVAGCQKRGDAAVDTAQAGADATPPAAVPAPPEDGPPRMTNADPPFRYPAALYAQKVQGNVTLRLWVDSAGAVLPESTRVTEPSGYPALDSSAVAGSEKLRFAPGMRDGRPTGAAILFPVYFRHPEAAPLPGDTVLRAPRP
jgi:protein TonB